MATALAAQLAQLAAAKPAQERYVRGKPSLLFDYQKAADVSVEQILNIARTGVEALIKADKRFTPFSETLFSRTSASTSREQLTAEENEALNTNLAAFLRVLTNHFLAAAAFQVLEYCIRCFKVHVFNVNELLLCALPYHATPEFARLLVLLQLKGSPWEWLAPGQQSGAPPPRDIIVRRCVNDHAVLRVVCQGAQAIGVPGFVSKTYLSFYAVLLCEVLATLPRVTEDLLTLLLPFLAAGLKGDASKEYTSATLMVLTQLLTRAQLSEDFLKVVALDVVRSWTDLGGPTVLMMMAHLATTQPHCSSVPLKALQVLSQEHTHVAQELVSLQARQANLGPLLRLLLPSVTKALPQNPGLEPLASALLQQVQIEPELVQAAAVQLLTAGAAAHTAAAEREKQQQHLLRVLRVFDLHYPDQLDAAINSALQAATAAGAAEAAAGDSSSGKGKKAKAGKKQQQGPTSPADALFEFVQACFAGSRHEVLAAVDSSDTQQHHQQQARTLSLAVHAPASEVRLMALQKLDAVCSTDGDSAAVPESTKQLLQTSLLSGLRDDVLAVAAVAAAAQGLADVPGAQQLPALQYLLQRAAVAISGGHVAAADATAAPAAAGADSAAGGAKDGMQAAKAALAAVAALGQRAAAAGDAALQQQAAGVMLEYVLSDKRCKKLSKATVKAASECSWNPLLQALSSCADAAAAAEAAAPADTAQSPDSKRRKKGGKQAVADSAADAAAGAGKHSGALALNRAVVSALAGAVGEDTAAGAEAAGMLQQVEVLLSSSGPRCRQLLLLVLASAAAAAAAAPGKGASKGSKQGKGSKAAAAGAPVAAAVAAVLTRALEQQLASAVSTAEGAAAEGGRKQKLSKAVAALLPASWAEEAAELLDATQLPTKQHMQQLPLGLQHLNAVLLLSGLHAALSAAPAASLVQVLGQPVQLFARLAAAAAAEGSHSAAAGLLQHLQLLVEKSGESSEQQLSFLSSIYGLPSGIAGRSAQAVSLQLLPQVVSSSSGSSGDSSTWFVRLLAAANSTSKDVREAAVAALLSLPASNAVGEHLAAAHTQQLVTSLQQHEQLLKGAAGALQRLLCSAAAAVAAGGAAAMDLDSPGGAAASGGRSRRGSKTGSKGKAGARESDAAAAAPAVLQLSNEAAAAVLQLLRGSLPGLSSDGDLLAAQLAVAVLTAGQDQAACAEGGQQLLQQLVVKLCKQQGSTAAKGAVWPQLVAVSRGAEARPVAAAELQQLRTDVAASLLELFTPAVLQAGGAVADGFVHLLQAPFSAEAAAAVLGDSSSTASLSASQLAAVAAVRVAALQVLTPEAFAALQPQQQQAAFTAALQTLAADGSAACRAAARECLQQLPVSAAMLLVLLQAAVSPAQAHAAGSSLPAQPKAKRARKSSAHGADTSGLQVQSSGVLSQDAAGQQAVSTTALDAAVAALEFMQWRDDIPDRQQLVQPLQQLLRGVVPLMGTIAETHQEDEAEAEGDALAGGVPATPAAAGDVGEASAGSAGGVSASAAGYAAQLVLLVLEQLVSEQLTAGAGAASSVDVELVLSCASAAPDGAVRNAALVLLAALGRLSPDDVLEHVLKALAVIQHSAALQADAHSQAVASTTLSALVPTWLAAGRGSEELWGSLLAALPGLPPHRRLGLLVSLLDALPQDKGLPVGLLLMMQQLVDVGTAKRAAGAAAGASPAKSKKGKKATAAEQRPEHAAVAAEDDQEAWLSELMASLCEKVEVQQRLAAFAAVLASSLSDSEGRVAAHEPLPRLAVSFVAVNLKAKSVSSAISAARSTAAAGSLQAQDALEASCQSIMTHALQHLLQLNPSADTQTPSDSKQARRLHKAINAAADGVYSLLSALEAVQDAPSYMLALVQMSRQPSDSVQRRALKLLADRLSKAQIDLADLEASAAELSAAGRRSAQHVLAEAGLAVCAELPRLLEPSTPAVTKQLALIAADAGIRSFGRELPTVVLASTLEVLKVVEDPFAAVRASALTCIAASVAALGMQLVPLLPKTAAAVLAAAEAAALNLAQLQQQGSSDSDDASDEGSEGGSESQQQQGQGKVSMDAGAAALQLAGAVAALEALVTNLGAFMSPYLPRLLQLLLHRQVLACTVADANAVAGRLRGALSTKVPARLLLEPLLQQWEGAVAACAGGAAASDVDAAPAVALLDLVAAFCSHLEPGDAVKYHEQLAGLLLQALGTRSRWLASTAGHTQQLPSAAAAAADAATVAAAAAAVAGFSAQQVWEVEGAAVRALAVLTMKLSESRFKPMFLRMLDWTNAASGGDSQQQQGIGRVAALLAAVCTFSERLRGVFSHYYRYFFTLLMQQLAGEGLSGGKRSKKKRKLSAAAADAAGGDAALLSSWMARLRAVRAVHLLALHEGSQHESPAARQEQQERFDKLMPLLVELLQEGPPAAVAAQLAVQGADLSLDLPNSPAAALGAVGAAIAEAGASKVVEESCDILGTAAVGALVQMAVSGGSDVVWKPLHHALLLATRGGSTRAKLLALGGVSRLAELLREDYLNLLPEALGFIAELVEDGELAVEAAAQGLLAQLESMSGEKLEQYLKAG